MINFLIAHLSQF